MTRTLTAENKAAMQEGRKKARGGANTGLGGVLDSSAVETHKKIALGPFGSPLACVRRKCLDCQGGWKAVKYCPSDGINSTNCELWPYRFGMRPQRAVRIHGIQFLTPKDMPPASVALETLP